MRFTYLQSSSRAQSDELSRIVWYEGQLLLPQHFQQWDARMDGLLARQARAAHPFCWGVDELSIDIAALSAGTLRLTAAAGQFRDGLTFAWNASLDNGRLECPLLPQATERYAIAVPVHDFSEAGVDVHRFRRTIGEPVADHENKDEKVPIHRWTPHLSLRPWNEADRHYSQIPVVEVMRTAAGFRLGPYHPPAACLQRESACGDAVERLCHLLRSKVTQLDEAPAPARLSRDYRNGLRPVVMALIASVPRLEAQLAGAAAHPYDIFLTLCDIAGHIASITGRAPPLFPAYLHVDPQASIQSAIDYVEGVVEGISAEHFLWVEVPFKQGDSGSWSCQIPSNLPAPLLLRCTFASSVNDAVISAWLDRTLICWAEDEATDRENRIKGLSRRHSGSLPEMHLSAGPSQRYVQVDATAGSGRAHTKLLVGAGTTAIEVTGISLLIWERRSS